MPSIPDKSHSIHEHVSEEKFVNMIFDELLDYFLQFIGREIVENWINRVCLYLSKLFVSFRSSWSKFTCNKLDLPKLGLLHRSNNFLVIDKPHDLLINSNDGRKISVQTLLSRQYPNLRKSGLTHEFYFPHRLDYSTSGILCIPLNKKACAEVSKSFENRTSRKYYVALLNGHLDRDFITVDVDIGADVRHENTNKKMCTISENGFCSKPRKSVSHIVALDRGSYSNRLVTKVLIKPITGRRHQIRLHSLTIGHPILGDYTYGFAEDKAMSRMYLHAIRLIVPNNIEKIDIETEDPFRTQCLPEWKSCSEKPNDFREMYNIFDE